MFYLIEVVFPLMFILVLVMVIFTFAQGIYTWHQNQNFPRNIRVGKSSCKTPKYHASQSC